MKKRLVIGRYGSSNIAEIMQMINFSNKEVYAKLDLKENRFGAMHHQKTFDNKTKTAIKKYCK